MGKRSTFERRARDFYPTPPEAVAALIPHLPSVATYIEPMAGAGDLVRNLAAAWPGGACTYAADLEPQAPGIGQAPLGAPLPLGGVDLIITNPPWPAMGGQGEPVLSMARHLAAFRPTWFLLSSDFAFNRYFGEVEDLCAKIVAVGRVSWEGNGVAGKDNAAWYQFDARHVTGPAFYGRRARRCTTRARGAADPHRRSREV